MKEELKHKGKRKKISKNIWKLQMKSVGLESCELSFESGVFFPFLGEDGVDVGDGELSLVSFGLTAFKFISPVDFLKAARRRDFPCFKVWEDPKRWDRRRGYFFFFNTFLGFSAERWILAQIFDEQ